MNRNIRLTYILVFFIVIVSCDKVENIPKGSSAPRLNNATADSLRWDRAFVSSSIVSLGFFPVTDHGFCWSDSPNPLITGPHVSLGPISSVSSFSTWIDSLKGEYSYRLRAYAISNSIIIYGSTAFFKTPELLMPEVTTSPVTGIKHDAATSGGVALNDGNGIISARGICWNRTGNPTLGNCDGFSLSGQGTGSFTSLMSGLIPGSSYFVSAYATNEKGTAYGEVLSFSTPLPCGELTVVYAGKIYQTVLIGNQCWFRGNLNAGERIDGNQNQDPNDGTIEKYCFDDLESNCDLYGGLYQWEEAMRGSDTAGAKGICPDGWHIPADEDWNALSEFLGGDSVAGTKMKTATGWYNNGNGTNSSGFSCLPGGNRGNDATFNNLTKLGYFWSSSLAGASEAWNRKLSHDSQGVSRYNSFRTNGFSLRCMRNE